MIKGKLGCLQQIAILLISCLSLISMPYISAQESNEKSVYRIARSGNRRILAITYSSGGRLSSTIELYDSSTGQFLRTADVSPGVPERITLSPAGDRIAYAGTEGELGIFNTTTLTNTIISRSSSINVDVLAWNPMNDEIAYALGSGVYILDAASGSVVRTIGTGAIRVVELAWSPNGQELATSHYTEDAFKPSVPIISIKTWDLATGENQIISPTVTIENRGGGHMDWSPDATRLAILEHNRLFIYDLSSDQSVADLPFEENSPAIVVWSPDGRFVATGGTMIRIWDTKTWQVARTIPVTGAAVSLQWSPDSEHLYNDGGSSGLYLDDVPVSEIQAPKS